jgi:hypothetical protein
MATILDIKPVEKIVQVAKLSDSNKSELLRFLGIMREKKEFEKLKAMKEVADAKYRVKSFSRQVREIERNIAKVKVNQPVKTFYIAEPVSEPIPEPVPIEVIKPIEPNNTMFSKADVIIPVNIGFDIRSKKSWKCEKCSVEPFPAKKLLKLHISESHSY